MGDRTVPVVNVTQMFRRVLPAQPVLRLVSRWDPSNPDSGAGPDLARIRKVMAEQGLEQAGTPYVCVGEADDDGRVMGEAVVPVDQLGIASGAVEAVVQSETHVVSVLYRDDIHLTSGQVVLEHVRSGMETEGLAPDGLPRWIYHTNPTWNLLPDDHLIELAWPFKTSS